MKLSFYLVVFAICAALHFAKGQDGLPPPPPFPENPSVVSYDYLRPLDRVVRQLPEPPAPPPGMPPMPPMPPPPEIPQFGLNRKRRSPKGGAGSMPTRKG